LFDSTVTYHEAEHASNTGAILPKEFPATQVPTPAINSCCAQAGQKCVPAVAQWQTPTWQALNFSVDDPHYYSYHALRITGTGSAVNDRYDLNASGDLDCDGLYAFYSRAARVDAQYGVYGGSGLFIISDIE
jgi:hypothetical protein